MDNNLFKLFKKLRNEKEAAAQLAQELIQFFPNQTSLPSLSEHEEPIFEVTDNLQIIDFEIINISKFSKYFTPKNNQDEELRKWIYEDVIKATQNEQTSKNNSTSPVSDHEDNDQSVKEEYFTDNEDNEIENNQNNNETSGVQEIPKTPIAPKAPDDEQVMITPAAPATGVSYTPVSIYLGNKKFEAKSFEIGGNLLILNSLFERRGLGESSKAKYNIRIPKHEVKKIMAHSCFPKKAEACTNYYFYLFLEIVPNSSLNIMTTMNHTSEGWIFGTDSQEESHRYIAIKYMVNIPLDDLKPICDVQELSHVEAHNLFFKIECCRSQRVPDTPIVPAVGTEARVPATPTSPVIGDALAVPAAPAAPFDFSAFILEVQVENAPKRKGRPRKSNQQMEFKCDFEKCGKLYSKRSDLIDHIKKEHFGIKKFKCSFCSSRFGSKILCKKHEIDAHTQTYPHNCKTCKKGFIYYSQLKYHATSCKN